MERNTIMTNYYVSPNGDDTNSGTSIGQPLATIAAAHALVEPGDTIFLRGGTYNLAKDEIIRLSKSGTEDLPITLKAFEDEVPILDASNWTRADAETGSNGKVMFYQTGDYWHVEGLEITGGPFLGYLADSVNGSVYKDLNVHSNDNSGFNLFGDSSNNLILGGDFHKNFDPHNNGQDADGIAIKFGSGEGNVIDGARVYNNADDGLDFWEFDGSITVRNSMVFENGIDIWGHGPSFEGNGNGIKLSGGSAQQSTDIAHVVHNNIVWGNPSRGIDYNGSQGKIQVYNNTSYNNGFAGFFFVDGEHVLRNNVSFDNGVDFVTSGNVDDANNSWTSDVEVDADDFVSLDDSDATGPRNADGSLPASDFLKLAPGSDLIGAGIEFRAGTSNTSADLGAFEVPAIEPEETEDDRAALDQTLGGGVGNDILIGGDGADVLTGGPGDDRLIGGDGNDQLFGGDGADRMEGGVGNDIFYINDTRDRVIERADAGTDHVFSHINVNGTLIGANVENITLLGSSSTNASGNARDNIINGNAGNNILAGGNGADVLTGGAGSDRLFGGNHTDHLIGGDGNDILNGQAGADRMDGGAGDDKYFINNYEDRVIENADGGTDSVFSTIYINRNLIGDHVENITLLGGNNLNAWGNGRDNTIIGNWGDNKLGGGDGTDVLNGGAGNDRLFGGNDDDRLFGGDGDDMLNGQGGADRMLGGLGDDIYYMNNYGDRAIEAADAGTDHVFSTIYINRNLIGDHVENITLLGGNDLNAWANARDNVIIGNTGDNRLGGGNGDDVLNGGAGDDSLYGNLGTDTFVFDVNGGNDVINDFDDNFDVIDLSSMDTDIGSLSISTTDAGDTLIDYGTGTIRLRDFDVNGLDAGDFLFA